MSKFYFQYASEGAIAVGISAKIIEAKDKLEACWKFVQEYQDTFYGASPDFENPSQAYSWIKAQVKMKDATVHGCFEIPEILAKSADDSELWTLYEDSDVRTFFKIGPRIPPAQAEKILLERHRQREEQARATGRIQHSPGFGYVVPNIPVEKLRITSIPDPGVVAKETIEQFLKHQTELINQQIQERLLAKAFPNSQQPIEPKPPEPKSEKPKTDAKTYYPRKLGL